MLGLTAAQAITVTPNVADGEVLRGERVIRVVVQAPHPVTSVEFYVDDDLRDSDSSVPYEFRLDTLAEKEGELTLTFAAYTTEGTSGRRVVRVVVDNEIGRGAEFHVQRGLDYLGESKWAEAIQAGRAALKAQPGYNPARIVMARAYLGQGVLDSAQKFAEDALAADPKLDEAADLLAAVSLRRAFATVNRGGSQDETLRSIRDALTTAVNSRRRVLDRRVDEFGPVTAENRIEFADAAIRAGRFSLAVSELLPVLRVDNRNTALINRVAFAQMRAGRYAEAFQVLADARRFDALDGYSYAMLALIESKRGNESGADDAMREAMLGDPDNIGVRTAQAALAVRRGRTDTLANLASSLTRDAGERSEVHYYLYILFSLRNDPVEAERAFQRTVLAEPANHTIYVERANQALAIVANSRIEQGQRAFQTNAARAFYAVALAARPESPEALTGLALVDAMNRNWPDAYRNARAAVSAARDYAPGQYALSAVAAALEADLRARAEQVSRRNRDGSITDEMRAEMNRLISQADNLARESQEANQAAGRLDPAMLGGRQVPNVMDAYNYFARHGRIPLITAPR
ncbi:MAG: tetratricopeptide repeat protein [Fimbriimonadaceae bacterium]